MATRAMSGAGYLDALRADAPSVRVVVAEVAGSAPREAGAAMRVDATGAVGTIGGGALEYEATALAREMLAEKAETSKLLARPLGPALGQCCGGFVRLWFERVEGGAVDRLGPEARVKVSAAGGDAPVLIASETDIPNSMPVAVAQATRAVLADAQATTRLLRGVEGADWLIEPLQARRTPLTLYGAGHVGRALARVLEDLPFDLVWVDTERARFPETIPAHATPLAAADPALAADHAPDDAIHLVMSYSHAIDFAVCSRVLARGRFAHLGLLGSATKRARFLARLEALGVSPAMRDRLISPIGVEGVRGKAPAEIAISVAAQLLRWREEIRAQVRDPRDASPPPDLPPQGGEGRAAAMPVRRRALFPAANDVSTWSGGTPSPLVGEGWGGGDPAGRKVR